MFLDRLVRSAFLTATAVLVVTPVMAQRAPLSLELAAGFAVPSGAMANGQRDLALNTGLAAGATLLVHMGPELALYGSWSEERFGCAPNFDCDVEGGFTSRGFEVGAEYVLPHETVWEPWVRAGATLHRFRYHTGGGFETETEPAAGFELGGGVNIPVSPRMFVSPSMRFARYVAHLNLNTFAAGGAPFTVTRVLVEVGARFRP